MLVPVVIATVGMLLSVLLALAVNEVSTLGRWPGWLDLIRRPPVRAVVLILAATCELTVISTLIDRRGPEPASSVDVLDAEERIKGHISERTQSTLEQSGLLERLPLYPREIIAAPGDDQAAISRVVKAFANPAIDPYTLAREWGASAPQALDDLPVTGRLAVAELLHAYGQPGAASDQIRAAVLMGVTPRAYWLVRAAQIAALVFGEDATQVQELLDEAQAVDSGYPLLIGLRHSLAQQWQAAESALAPWNPGSA